MFELLWLAGLGAACAAPPPEPPAPEPPPIDLLEFLGDWAPDDPLLDDLDAMPPAEQAPAEDEQDQPDAQKQTDAPLDR